MKKLFAIILIIAMLCGCALADTGSDVVDTAKLYLELMYLAYERDPAFVAGYVNEIYSYTMLYFAGECIKSADRGKTFGIDGGISIEGYVTVIRDVSAQYSKYRDGEMTLDEYMAKMMTVIKIFVHAGYQ